MASSTSNNKTAKIWAAVTAALVWMVGSMLITIPGIIVNVLLTGLLVAVLVAPAFRVKLWAIVRKPPPAKPPLLRALGLMAVSILSIVLAIAWIGEPERIQQEQDQQKVAITRAKERKQAKKHLRFLELRNEARKLAADPATIDKAIAKYIEAREVEGLAGEDVSRLAGLHKSKGDALEADGDLAGAVTAYQQAQTVAPQLDGIAAAIAAIQQRQATEARRAAADKHKDGIKCARAQLKSVKKSLKRTGGYRLVQMDIDKAADCLAQGTQAVIAAIETWGSDPKLDKIAKSKTTTQLTAQLKQLKERAAKMEAKVAEREAKRDNAHLQQIINTIGRKAGYVTNVETGEGGHNYINVYVNQAWHYKPKTVKEEQIRIIEQLIIPHLQAFHPTATPRISIYDQSGKRIGKTGLLGVSVD